MIFKEVSCLFINAKCTYWQNLDFKKIGKNNFFIQSKYSGPLRIKDTEPDFYHIDYFVVFCYDEVIQLLLTQHPNTRGAYFELFVNDQLF